MTEASPSVIVLAGPNGAGKTTAAPVLLKETLGIVEFVNADTIASGLSGFAPERTAFAAGRLMLERIKQLAEQRASFAFETTLASRTFAPWLSLIAENGYEIHLLYLWLSSADLAVERVRDRTHYGGHDVPEPTIRRRFQRSLNNLFYLYLPIATIWRVYDNCIEKPILVASGCAKADPVIVRADVWKRIRQGVTDDI